MIEDGFYKIYVVSSVPECGIIGDNQVIDIFFAWVPEMPELYWPGVPYLGDQTEGDDDTDD